MCKRMRTQIKAHLKMLLYGSKNKSPVCAQINLRTYKCADESNFI